MIILWYQTLDNCDGKHAKRTKSGSPLGHLFDHGCDALSNTIVGLQIACAMQFGYSTMTLLVTASGGFMQSYFATWEEVRATRPPRISCNSLSRIPHAEPWSAAAHGLYDSWLLQRAYRRPLGRRSHPHSHWNIWYAYDLFPCFSSSRSAQ